MVKTTKPMPVHETSGPVKIDKNIPMPADERRLGPRKYPWYDMRIGDSFEYPGTLQSATNLANLTSLKLKPNEFKAKMVGPGSIRIWRTN